MPFSSGFASALNGTRNTGPFNMGGGPNLITRSLFSTSTPTLPYSQWYVPGNGSPAISTADYYLINGLYWTRPYDLDTMGAEGAVIKAREGMRYVWMMAPDHPQNSNYIGGGDFYVGYSNDPQVWPDPTTVRVIRAQESQINVVDQNGYTQNAFFAYQTPFLVYNPDTNVISTDKFWIYAEGVSSSSSRQHELTLFTTSDFLTTTLIGPTIPTTSFNGWSSFGAPTRLGVNSWEVYAFGRLDGTGGSSFTPKNYRYTSTNGWTWTTTLSFIVPFWGPFFPIAGQNSFLSMERPGGSEYLSYWPVDANNQISGAATRISTAFEDNSISYPGPTYAQDVQAYVEDGIASITVSRGFPTSGPSYQLNNGPYSNISPTYFDVTGGISGSVLTVQSNTSGYSILVGYQITNQSGQLRITTDNLDGTYNLNGSGTVALGSTIRLCRNGGLWQQFIDLYFLITDSTTAAGAAPFGVQATCTSGVVTIQWNNCLPHQNYRIYRGTTSASQTTLIGTISGTSITDTPTAGSQYFYRVVTMNSGVEAKSRVVSVYASNNPLLYNKHFNRVINDGGDTSKIDATFLRTACDWLTNNDCWKYVNWWADVRFGIKVDGSGFISKVYCLGTTYLPRGGDYTPTTSGTFPSTSSNTSYVAGGGAGSFRGTTASWINNASSAHGYFGNGRVNNIRRWTECTFLSAYQRPSGTGNATLWGQGQFASGFLLQQPAGSSGNISFSMYASNNPPSSGPITATVAFASATTAKVVAGVFDGTNMIAYLDGTPGTPVSATSYSNPNLLNDTVLRGQYQNSIGQTVVLCSGGRGVTSGGGFAIDSEALFTAAALAAFNKGLSQSLIQSWGALYA